MTLGVARGKSGRFQGRWSQQLEAFTPLLWLPLVFFQLGGWGPLELDFLLSCGCSEVSESSAYPLLGKYLYCVGQEVTRS